MSLTLTDTGQLNSHSNIPTQVKIVEVGPRDGLQNETQTVSIETRTALIDRLSNCGFSAIEIGSFVSPKRVPQMTDSEAVYSRIKQHKETDYIVLVANRQGLERALESQVKCIAVFCAASEAFSLKNNNCSIDENLKRIEIICQQAQLSNIKVRGYVSCVLGCPYQGAVDLDRVATIATKLYQAGCYEISLGDTIGVGNPVMVKRLVEASARNLPIDRIAVHFHDTYGQALVNTFAALEYGVRIIDSSVAGLGGCPFAPNASGNLASEDLVYLLNGLGIKTGISLKSLVSTAWFITGILQRQPDSKVSHAIGN